MAMDAFSASLMQDKREIIIAPTIYKFCYLLLISQRSSSLVSATLS